MRGAKGKRVWSGLLCLGILLAALLVAGCGDDAATTTATAAPTTTQAQTTTTQGQTTTTTQAETTTTTQPPAPVEFTVLVSNPSLYPFYEQYVAVTQGFFAARNLNVQVVPVDGTPGIIQNFAAGLGDIAFGDLGSLLRGTATEQFLPVAFYITTNRGVFDIMVPEDSPIQSYADLDGKVIGANSEDDPGAALIRALNTFAGINAQTLYVGDLTQAVAAFDRGDIVAYASSLPDIAVIEARGVPFRSVAPPEILAVNGGSGFWAKRELMDAQPEAFKAFVAAIQEAHEYIGDDAQKLVDWANAQEPIPAEEMAFNLALAGAIISLRPTDVSPLGYIDPATWLTWWDGLVANGVIDPAIGAPTDFYTNEFQG